MNIALIGFMASGKSTLAKQMAKNTGRTLISIDEEIIKEQGISIDEIFASCGEKFFRELETLKLEKVLASDDQIIDCGGGAIIYNEDLITTSCYVIFVNTPFDIIWNRLTNDDKRPLIKGKTREEVKALYDSRVAIYRDACDEVIDSFILE